MELVSKKGGYRDLKYDNLKGLAIFLVVVAHCIVNVAIFTKGDAAASLGIFRLIVVLFPMSLFVFASGYFSKIREGESIKTFRNILIPYFIFNTILFILTYFAQGDANFGGLYIVPEVTMWYLLCLFLWRIFLLGLDKIRHVTILSIILAVLICVLTFKGTFLSFSRFICLLPFFLGGFYYDSFKEKIQKFFSSDSTISKIGGNKIVNLIVLVATALGSLYVLKNYSVEVLMLKDNYDGLNMGSIEGMALRFMIIIASFIIIFCLINLMTSRNTFLVKWGQNSLSVYVLYYFLLWLIPIGVFALGSGFIFQNLIVVVLFVFILSAALTAILSIDKVTEGVWLCNSVAKIVMKD